MNDAATIKTHGLGKDYGDRTALFALDGVVNAGEIVGLLGPNGAGKTTTMKLFLGLLRPSRGRAEVLGLDCTSDSLAVKARIGFVPDEPSFYEFLTGRETIGFVAKVRGCDEAAVWRFLTPLIATLDFQNELDVLVSGYSHGMKKKLALLCALAHQPKVLLLDEPTNGLDPAMAAHTRDLFTELAREQNVAILLSTHLLDMADRLCHRLWLLDHGKLIANGTPGQVRERAGVAASDSLENAFLRLTA